MHWFWYLKFFWRFVVGIPAAAKEAWEVSDWSRYSRGRFLDQGDTLVMRWNDLLTAWLVLWQVRRSHKRRRRWRKNVAAAYQTKGGGSA